MFYLSEDSIGAVLSLSLCPFPSLPPPPPPPRCLPGCSLSGHLTRLLPWRTSLPEVAATALPLPFRRPSRASDSIWLIRSRMPFDLDVHSLTVAACSWSARDCSSRRPWALQRSHVRPPQVLLLQPVSLQELLHFPLEL